MRLSAFGTIRKLGKKKDHDAVSPYSTSASNESTTEPLPRSTNLSRSQSNTGTLENISNQPQAASKQTPETAALTIQISNLMQTVEELQQNNRILTAENIQLSQKLRVEQDKTKHLERELAKYRPNPSITSTSISPQQKPVTSAGYTATVNRSTTSTSISEQQQQQKPPSFRSNSPAAVPKYHSASLRDQLSSQMSELESLLLSMSNASLNGETK
jgi:hypothetical protein